MEWIFSYIAIAASLVSLIIASMSWYRTRKMRLPPSWRKRFDDSELLMLELMDRVDKLTAVAKRKYSRDAARSSRSKANGTGIPDPEQDPEGWKREMQKRFALGEFKR